MKALTVLQPWAALIMSGQKTVENRTWRTSHRGPLLIHAGASRLLLGAVATVEPPEEPLVFGALLGTVELVECVRLADARTGLFKADWLEGPFTTGPWCWLLANPKPLRRPVPYRGRQMLFDVPDEFVRDPVGFLLHGLN